MTERRSQKSVTFNPLVAVVSVGTVDQAAERSLTSGSSSPILARAGCSNTNVGVPVTTSEVQELGIASSFSGTTFHQTGVCTGANVSASDISIANQGACGSGTNPCNNGNETTNSAEYSLLGQSGEGRNVPQTTYKELQEDLNKFMKELQLEEARFLEQVQKVNKQGTGLKSNNEKINKLQSTVATLKDDQNRINEALVFVRDQQSEMENILGRLESSMPDFTPEVDPSRLHLYELTNSIGHQLLDIDMDLQFVKNHVNKSDSRASKNNCPITTALKVLNEHATALTWVEESCDRLKQSLHTVKQEHEAVKQTRIATMRY